MPDPRVLLVEDSRDDAELTVAAAHASGLKLDLVVRHDAESALDYPASGSDQPSDVADCCNLGVNRFVKKPVDHAAFQALVAQLGRYWLHTNIRPPLLRKVV